MSRFVYRPQHPDANENGMLDLAFAPLRAYTDPRVHVISDIMEPTRHMATGRIHTSKSEFRKDTKAAGCVEVGNDSSYLNPKKREWVPPSREQRREDIRRAIHTLKNNGNPIWEK